MDVNKVTLVGHLVRDPMERVMPSGQKLASFSVATSYMWRDQKTKEKKDKTEFHRVVAWGRLAEIINTYLKKGSRVYLEGRIQYREWQDKSGAKRATTEVIADELIMLGHSSGSSPKNGSNDALAKEEPDEKELVVEEV